MRLSTFATIGALLTCPTAIHAQSDYTSQLQFTLALLDTASSAETRHHVATALRDVSDAHPTRWEAAYWAAHEYSQVGLFNDVSIRGAFLDTAQTLYDRAWNAAVEKDNRLLAEFYVLQANLHALRGGVLAANRQWEEAGQNRALRNQHLQMTGEAYPNNPRLHVLRGIQQLADSTTRQEGRAILERAKQLYADPLPSPIWPNWGRPWIDHWLARYDTGGQ
jgi:hypothetical protein